MGRWWLGSRITLILVACLAVGVWLSGVGVARAAGWYQQSVPAPQAYGQVTLHAVSCISANACLAVGNSLSPQAAPGSDSTLSEWWDGSRWTIQPTPSPGSPGSSDSGDSLTSVSCLSSGECFAVGSSSWTDVSCC